MSDKIEVDGEEYELSDNPSLRTVRSVQSMQTNLLLDYIDEDDLRDMDSLEDESQIIEAILDTGGYEAFQNVMWERSMLEPVQTISLACDSEFTTEDFDDVGARDFREAKDKAEEALGGNASDFFETLGIGTSMSQNQMEQRATEIASET